MPDLPVTPERRSYEGVYGIPGSNVGLPVTVFCCNDSQGWSQDRSGCQRCWAHVAALAGTCHLPANNSVALPIERLFLQRTQDEHGEGAFRHRLAFLGFDVYVAYGRGAPLVRRMRADGEKLRFDGANEVRRVRDGHIG